MSKDDISGERLLGCLGATLTLLVSIPLWYVILFYVLHAIHAPPWIWAAYWVYVPSGVIAGVLQQASRLGNNQE